MSINRSEITWYLQLKGNPIHKLEKLTLKEIRVLYDITKNPIKEPSIVATLVPA